ncbi:MAG: hypothetical protein AB4058_13585 [Microcystaceae cyanobacterium]
MVFNQLKSSFDSFFYDIKYKLTIRNRLKQIPLLEKMARIKASEKYQNQKSLIPYGDKVYSQADEDGIIREIFNRIGTTNKTFVEFGIGNGLENNSLALLFDNWQG